MEKTVRHQVLAALVAVAIGLGIAAPAGAAELSEKERQEAKSQYDRATRLYDLGKYAESIEAYQKAYEIGGDPNMLYNIAQAYRLNDQPAEASRFYRRYLQRAGNPRNQADVEKKIAEMDKLAEAKGSATTPPPGGGGAVTTTPPPGGGTITTTPPPGGGTVTTTTPPAGGGMVPPLGGGTVPPAPASDPLRSRRMTSYWLMGGGAGMLLVSMITGGSAISKASQLGQDSRNGEVYDPSLQSKGQALNIVAITSFLIALGLGGAGGYLYYTVHSAEKAAAAPPAATVAPMAGPGTIGAMGTFTF